MILICILQSYLTGFAMIRAIRLSGEKKAIAHYQHLNINPLTKRLVFSDGLDVPTAIALYRHFRGRISTFFGIGTNLSTTPHIRH